jgi:hypothetical protein
VPPKRGPARPSAADQILALARATEEAGFDAFFRSDHYLGIDPDDTGYRPTDSWTTLAGLAVQTERVRLGTTTSRTWTTSGSSAARSSRRSPRIFEPNGPGTPPLRPLICGAPQIRRGKFVLTGN